MGKLKCTECGQIFDDTLKECPNCACPASECERIVDVQSAQTNQNQQENKREEQYKSIESSNSFTSSHKLIECSDCGAKISIDTKRCPHCGAKGKYAPLDFGNAIYDCFCRKFGCTSGRSRRSEVFPFIIMGGMMIITILFLSASDTPSSNVFKLFFYPLSLIAIIPINTAIVRRLHDIGRSGLWILLPLFPIIFIFKDSDKIENEYGKSPKYQSNLFTEELPDKGSMIGYVYIAIYCIVLLFLLVYLSNR